VAGSLVWGLLVGDGNRKAALIAGLLLLSTALWCFILDPTDTALRLVCGAAAAGAGMTILGASAVILSATVLTHSSALAVLYLVLPVGMLCNPVLSPETLRYVAATLATISLASAIAMPMPLARPNTRELAKPGLLILTVLFLAAFGFFEGAVWNWLAPFFIEVRIVDQHDGWLVLSYCVPLGLIVGRIGAARLLGNVAPLKVAAIASLAMAFAAGMMLVARTPSAAWIAAFCLGVTIGPVLPAALGIAYRASPRRPALGMSLPFAAGSIGAASCISSIRMLTDRFGLSIALLTLPAAALLMAALYARAAGRYSSTN